MPDFQNNIGVPSFVPSGQYGESSNDMDNGASDDSDDEGKLSYTFVDAGHLSNMCVNCKETKQCMFACFKCANIRVCLDCRYQGIHRHHNTFLHSDIG